MDRSANANRGRGCGQLSMSSNAVSDREARTPARRSAPSGTSAANDRKARAYRHASRHSARVRVLKMALPALALLFVAAFFLFTYSPGLQLDRIELGGGIIQNGKLVMANPVLKGFTKDNLPYHMTAARAVQDVGNSDRVDLRDIRASVPIDGRNTATISARSGSYDNVAQKLKIDSPLVVKTDDGMTARLRSADIEMKSGNLQTDDPVDIDREGSRIRAQSMRVKDRGRVMIFERNVRLTIAPDQPKSAVSEQPGQGTVNAQ